MSKCLYNTREHEGDQLDNRSEENKPIFTHIFLNTSIIPLLLKAPTTIQE